MVDAIIRRIQEELNNTVDPSPKRGPQSFFKEEVKFHGVKTATVEKMAGEFYKLVQSRSKNEIFALCDSLLQTDYLEEAFIACEWSYRLRDQYELADFETFEAWVNKYINNWAKCDTLCNHTVGAFVERFPGYVERLKRWAKSDNRWVRRAAAVTLILPARKGMFLKDVFEIAGILLMDKEDLVQKGYGWMLKEASRNHQQAVFEYVMGKRSVMPRTAFRYAIEKMPEELKRRAMDRE